MGWGSPCSEISTEEFGGGITGHCCPQRVTFCSGAMGNLPHSECSSAFILSLPLGSQCSSASISFCLRLFSALCLMTELSLRRYCYINIIIIVLLSAASDLVRNVIAEADFKLRHES